MGDCYDLVVIGSGTAAMVAATRTAAAGWKVAMIDDQPFGGTCALRGCDPKKMMVSAEEAIEAARRMAGRGVDGELSINWPELLAFKRDFTEPISEKRAQTLARLSIDAIDGTARFTARDRVQAGKDQLAFKHALIATGAHPVPLGIPGEQLLATSDDFLELAGLPSRILFIGGGYIAAEFSHLAARAGARVTVVQHGPALLDHFDGEVVGWLMPRFEELGIQVHLSTEVVSVQRSRPGFKVTMRQLDNRRVEHETDLVIHAAGRVPQLDRLDLAAGGIAAKNGRLSLQPNLRSTSNSRIFAAGDAAGMGPPLTPVSSHDAKIAAANMLDGGNRRPNYLGVPSVVFTIPALAAVGLKESEARDQGLDFELRSEFTPDWFTARRLGETIYGHKVLVERVSGRILGAHLVGPAAEEVINLFALAVRQGLTADQLKDTMFAYPTGASDIGYMLA
ncbi:NAD(P)/FAD-dependent oxidoreductase [Sphingomonas sp.]|uniref:dihydrolipoyl dehydrogenase family protein n=1 Tax=Sphingomonas sp. TaxID=28214 RepID=UPI0017A3B48F|nr:NAD(P)/FAD-dependent oxidoreductase [Sphingomonas sp.]MBA3511120.1 NAD(P)/FAD-dependent oxidoreductase [Sphingomonas sp.]